MIESFPPFLVFILGAFVLMVLPNGRVRNTAALLIPAISAWMIWTAPEGNFHVHEFMGLELVIARVDKLSTVFGLIFSLVAEGLSREWDTAP